MPYLHDRRIYLNRRYKDDQYYTIIEEDGNNFILCYSFLYNKVYVYTETGILVSRLPYPEIAEKCGKPVTISEDGKILIFRKSHLSRSIYIVNSDITGLSEQRSIDIVDQVAKYLNSPKAASHMPPSLLSQAQTFWKVYLKECKDMSLIKISMGLNDQGDAIIGIAPHPDFKEKLSIEVMDLPMFNGKEVQAEDLLLEC